MESSNAEVPLATMVKKQGGATYVFAVTLKPGETQAVFTLEDLPAGAEVEVLGEHRKIEPAKGRFKDHFGNWAVHLYRIQQKGRGGTKMTWQRVLTTAAVLLAATMAAGAGEPEPAFSSPYAQWKNGPPKDDSFFPIGVCTQEPSLAPRYQKAGINFYEGLWKGPTEAQLAELKKWGMPVSCSQNAVGLAHKDDPIIIGLGDRRGRTRQRPGAPVGQ